ncbi:MAG: penicillin-binding protein 2 [bacterium]
MLQRFRKTKYDNPFTIQEGLIDSARPHNRYRMEHDGDMFIKDKAGNEKLGRNFNFRKLIFIRILFILIFIILISRVYYLQVVKGEYYNQLANGNRIRIERIEARRGVIYDRDMKPLVYNIANFLLYFIPADLPDDEQLKIAIIKRLSEILEIPVDEITSKLAEVDMSSLEIYQPLFIIDKINYEKAMLIYLESSKMPGVMLSNQTRREYHLPSLSLSHVIGYTGKISQQELATAGREYSLIDYYGKTGIESFWESELRGVNGRKQIEVDALGKEKKIISESPVINGYNLKLTIDTQAQSKLEEILSRHLDKLGLDKGVAIVTDPNNGEILAMVSLPSYNNNIFARGITQEEYSELINHPANPMFMSAISGEYPSGSTIKPLILTAALEEDIVNEYTSFLSIGGLRIGVWFFPDWKAGGHGLTSARKAIAESVNTYFYYIGGGFNDFVGLGVDRITEYYEKFGLGKQTGIDLPQEADGFLPSKKWKLEVKGERWYVGDTYHISIGQGDLLVTPLQVAYYTGFFANGGTLYRPHLVKEILTADDKLFSEIDTSPVKQNMFDQHNVNIVREGMQMTVTSGSARSLGDLPVTSAGKTGTAQWSSKYPAHAWFTGWAPYNDPEITITILIDQGEEGSRTATPIAKEFLYWYFTRPKDNNVEEDSTVEEVEEILDNNEDILDNNINNN